MLCGHFKLVGMPVIATKSTAEHHLFYWNQYSWSASLGNSEMEVMMSRWYHSRPTYHHSGVHSSHILYSSAMITFNTVGRTSIWYTADFASNKQTDRQNNKIRQTDRQNKPAGDDGPILLPFISPPESRKFQNLKFKKKIKIKRSAPPPAPLGGGSGPIWNAHNKVPQWSIWPSLIKFDWRTWALGGWTTHTHTHTHICMHNWRWILWDLGGLCSTFWNLHMEMTINDTHFHTINHIFNL